ncbi:MAG: Gfo/Idh/MocA family oxidoreductase [Oscillatoria sp. PMC 1068.18]|nr:Gfo/Idh/MocA family oxidoreductase [Oscillatoria sp. PMC 1076.18]MEC4989324.1 Gfo/Idh/MocA family oxidoreductase [Oscillatoria sp. PMC 1068.18]
MNTKIAVLGAGRWGVHLIRNFHEHPQAEVVAVVDPHQDKLAACRERLQLDDKVIMAAEWESIRNILELDAVAIATPASTHYALITDALQLGYHVFAEKPLTLDPIQCQELCQLAANQAKQLFVDHTYLFHPAVIKGRELIESGELGELRYGYASRTHLGPVRQDVDALWDLAIHDLAIFNYWLQATPITVAARGKVWLQPNLADLVWVTLTYPNGFQAEFHFCWSNADKQRRLGVAGSKGTLIFDEMLAESPLTLQRGYFHQKDENFVPAGQNREVIKFEAAEPLQRVCDRFLESILKNQVDPISSGWVGTKLVEILSCLTLSLEQGGAAIAIPPEKPS